MIPAGCEWPLMEGAEGDPAHADDLVAVDARGLSVTYGLGAAEVVHAVAGASFSIKAGSWTCLFGVSGSGKSSLLHVIGGLLRPLSGSIAVFGTSLGDLGRARLARFRLESIGFVFQSFHLLPHLRAWENASLPLIARGMEPHERKARALGLLRDVGLSGRVHHRPGELSGGEQQRVAIARAMANRPRLLIADEPTGNLDSESAQLVLDALAHFVRGGMTLVCATHDQAVAARADRTLLMRDGRLSCVPTFDDKVDAER